MAISPHDKLRSRPPTRLRRRHRRRLRDFLVEDIDANLFCLSWLEHRGVEPRRRGRFAYYGWLDDEGDIHGVALDISDRLLLLDTRHRDDARRFGSFFRSQSVRFRHIVSRRRSVAPFWRVYADPSGSPPATARLIQHQRLYRLLPGDFDPPSRRHSPVRRGELSELDPIFLASVAMHREETQEDPLQRNPSTFHRHVRQRIEKGRTFVWFDDRRQLVFKADISTQSRYGAQISGVYTDPRMRNRGIATRAMTDICAILFEESVPRITLYVNEKNPPARRVYERLGFEDVAAYQTVFVAD